MNEGESFGEMELCRICRLPGDDPAVQEPLRAPCLCSGSMKYVHPSCLLEWINYSKSEKCHVCKHEYQITRAYRPLDISAVVRWLVKALVQAVTFSLVSLLWFLVFPVVVNMVFEVFRVSEGGFFVWLDLASEYRFQHYSLPSADALHEYLESEGNEPVMMKQVVSAFGISYAWGLLELLLVIGCGLAVLLLRDSISDYMEVRRIAQLRQPGPPAVPDINNDNEEERELPPPLEPFAPLAPARIIQQQQQQIRNNVEEMPFFDGLPAFDRQDQDFNQIAEVPNVPPIQQQPPPVGVAAEDQDDADILGIFGFRGSLISAIRSLSGFTAILFILVGFLEHVPRQVGSLILGDKSNDGFGSWHSLAAGYLILFSALIVYYIARGRQSAAFRNEFGALFLSLKLITMFTIEILVFPWLIGTVILWPLQQST